MMIATYYLYIILLSLASLLLIARAAKEPAYRPSPTSARPRSRRDLQSILKESEHPVSYESKQGGCGKQRPLKKPVFRARPRNADRELVLKEFEEAQIFDDGLPVVPAKPMCTGRSAYPRPNRLRLGRIRKTPGPTQTFNMWRMRRPVYSPDFQRRTRKTYRRSRIENNLAPKESKRTRVSIPNYRPRARETRQTPQRENNWEAKRPRVKRRSVDNPASRPEASPVSESQEGDVQWPLNESENAEVFDSQLWEEDYSLDPDDYVDCEGDSFMDDD